MLPNISPKDLAATIGVSESSLKRWVDEGRLAAARTAGGHRRIALCEAVRFLRRSAVDIARPEMLGIDDLTSDAVTTVAHGRGDLALLDAARDGDAARAKGLISAALIQARSVATICDGPIAFTINRLSEEIRASGDGKVVGERAARVLSEALSLALALLDAPKPHAPRAMGCTLPGPWADVARLMASCVLRESGYADSCITEETWGGRLAHLAPEAQPDLFWLCLSGPADRSRVAGMLTELNRLALVGNRPHAVICGRGVHGLDLASAAPRVLVAGSMCELQSIARASQAERSARITQSELQPRVHTRVG